MFPQEIILGINIHNAVLKYHNKMMCAYTFYRDIAKCIGVFAFQRNEISNVLIYMIILQRICIKKSQAPI